MGATALLSRTSLVVDAGGEMSLDVRVRNTGRIVDQLTLEVLGQPAAWSTVEPPTLSLFPDQEETATVRFAPPRAPGTHAGEYSFAVKVTSREDPEGSIVEEGTIWVNPFVELSAELMPRTSRGSRHGRHELALDNRGNRAVTVAFDAVDPDNLLRFAFSRDSLVAEPGTATFTKVVVTPADRFWRGAPKTLPFRVTAESDGQEPVTVDGAMLQQARLPAWLLPALAAAAALLAVLVVLWLTLLKPTVRSAAKEAAKEEVEEEQAAAQGQGEGQGEDAGGAGGGQGQGKGGAAGGGAGQGQGDDQSQGQGDGQGAGQGGDQAAATPFGDPRYIRLAVNGTGTKEDVKEIEAGTVFSLTDILLQNPAGDAGIVELRRDDEVLTRQSLANFRDLDFHFVAPVVFDAGQKVVLHVECQAGVTCTAAASLNGFAKQAEQEEPAAEEE